MGWPITIESCSWIDFIPVAYASWYHWTQRKVATINQLACPSYSLYVQLLWYPTYYLGGMKARESPVQWSKAHDLLPPLRWGWRWGGGGFNPPSGASQPPPPQFVLTPKNSQNKSKIHCWSPSGSPQIEYIMYSYSILHWLSLICYACRPVAGRGGSGGPDPPELLRMTFLNRVNPETFSGGG